MLGSLSPLCAAKDIGPYYGHEQRTIADWIKLYERPGRKRWQKPDSVIRFLDIKPGQSIADIGAGSGYFTVLFSRAVGADGKVYALDIELEYLDYIKKKTEKKGLDNIVLQRIGVNDPKLKPASQDIIFFCNTWHYVEGREAYLKKLYSALKPGGKLAIIDFKMEKIPFGPPYERRLPKSQLIREGLMSGFSLWAESYFLPFQYFVIFEKKLPSPPGGRPVMF